MKLREGEAQRIAQSMSSLKKNVQLEAAHKHYNFVIAKGQQSFNRNIKNWGYYFNPKFKPLQSFFKNIYAQVIVDNLSRKEAMVVRES